MTTNTFNKIFLGVACFMTLLYAFWLGADLQAGDTKGVTVDAVLMFFWGMTVILLTVVANQSRKLDEDMAALDEELKAHTGNLLDAMNKELEHHEKVHKAMHDALKVIGEDRPPKPSEYKKVENEFHRLSGDYLRLEAVAGDARPSATLSDTPFEARPTRKKAPVKKSAAKKTITKKEK